MIISATSTSHLVPSPQLNLISAELKQLRREPEALCTFMYTTTLPRPIHLLTTVSVIYVEKIEALLTVNDSALKNYFHGVLSHWDLILQLS